LKKLTKELLASLITVILAVLAIGLYISYGGWVFYVAITIAIAFGFYNAYLISVSEKSEDVPQKKSKRKGR
jgi:4-hydroxybenzoate polyprenyltransferase